MPSRRRSRSKNLNNNLADVQRRLRYLERRPVRTKLANRVVARAAIAPNAVSADEADFGTAVVVEPGDTIDETKAEIENPKDGLLVVDSNTGESQIYSENQDTYYDVSDPVAQGSADAAADAAALAAANAQAAQTSADGKNAVYRAGSAPTTPYTGTSFRVGDIWFDTSQDSQINRWSGTAWVPFTLGNNALASISANKITAGIIDASVITVSNLNASNITTGNLAASVISTTQLNATNITSGFLSASRIGAGTITASISITGPTIIGGTIKTSALNSDRRIEIGDADDIAFFRDNTNGNTSLRVGTITSINGQWSGGSGDDSYDFTQDGIMIYGGPNVASQGTQVYPSIVATPTNVYMYGDSLGSRFQAGLIGGTTQIGIYGLFGNYYTDFTYIYSGYSSTTRDGNTIWWATKMNGRLVWSENEEGPLSAGSGAPSTAGKYLGQICFRY